MSIVEIRLTIPTDDLELGQVLHDGEDVRIELTQLVPTGNTLIPYFWAETVDPSSFEETVQRDDRVASLERLGDGPEKYLYRIEWAVDIDGFLSALTEHDLVVETAVGGTEEWRFRLRGPDENNLSAFRETLRQAGISSSINGVWNPRESNNDPYGLTGLC